MQPSPKYNGDPTAQALAHGLATLGRYGDDYMVHASEGETVIPREILDANPQLKQDLFRQMIMMGIQDPNRYVVGSALNSLNPITGQPEFFFKKIWRAAKKIFKKAAPIIAPILGNLIAPGIGGLIASALTTKLMGGSWGDALKAGAITWGTQGLMGGISGAMEGGIGGILPGLGKGLMQPISALGGIFEGGAASPFAQGIFGSQGGIEGLLPQYESGAISGPGAASPTLDISGPGSAPPMAVAPMARDAARLPLAQGAPVDYMPAPQVGGVPASFPGAAPTLRPPVLDISGPGTMPPGAQASSLRPRVPDISRTPAGKFTLASGADLGVPVKMESGEVAWVNRATAETLQEMDAGGLLDPRPGARDDLIRANLSGPSASTPSGPSAPTPSGPSTTPGFRTKIVDGHKVMITPTGQTIHLGAAPKPDVSFYKDPKFYGQVAAGVIPAGLTYWAAKRDEGRDKGEDVPKDPENPQRIAYEKWKKLDPDTPEAKRLRLIWYGQPKYTGPQLATMFGATGQGAPAGARGGEVVGRGTGTSDSIPARLSDGEFVMTADAVRNAGNGNRDLGAARMYDMMSRFERRG